VRGGSPGGGTVVVSIVATATGRGGVNVIGRSTRDSLPKKVRAGDGQVAPAPGNYAKLDG